MANHVNASAPESTRWKPGVSPNPGGRPKKLLARVDEILHKAGKHPIEEILRLIPELKPREQVEAWLQIQQYVQAKPKGYDEMQDMMNDLKALSTAELLKIVKANHPELEEQKAG